MPSPASLDTGAMPISMRQRILRRWNALDVDRQSWRQHWQEITDFLMPRAGRYFTSDRNLGHKRHQNIIDNTGSRSLRVMAAGMMAGATSPARPWFALTTSDPELSEFYPVKLWLDDTRRRMMRVFAKSNTYRALHQMYEELGAFGTAVSIVLPNFDRVIHHYPVTTGEYALACDYEGRVNTLYREFEITVAQAVAEFGIDSVSESVRTNFIRGNLENAVTIIHAIEPRADRDPRRSDRRNMEWRSVYLENHVELPHSNDLGGLLRDSGFRRFPVLAPRWAVAGGDVYGRGPGMEALGDVKSLQVMQLRKGQAIDYKTLPPLEVPSTITARDVHAKPGGITQNDSANPNSRIKTLFDVDLDLSHMLEDIRDVRDRITSSFYADLFLMLANAGPDTRMTATEVAERHEEKLLMLGPVLERLHNELLEPLIDMTFERMLESGALLPPPPELAGTDLSIEFVSMLAQAQRAVGVNSIDRFLGTMGAVMKMKPQVIDKLDEDALADTYSEMLGVPPNVMRSNEDVAAEREARNKAQAAADEAKVLETYSKSAKNLAQGGAAQGTAPGNPSGITDLVSLFSGYSSPPPQEA